VGDVLSLIENVDENWIRARNVKTNTIGVVPVAFLSEITPDKPDLISDSKIYCKFRICYSWIFLDLYRK